MYVYAPVCWCCFVVLGVCVCGSGAGWGVMLLVLVGSEASRVVFRRGSGLGFSLPPSFGSLRGEVSVASLF